MAKAKPDTKRLSLESQLMLIQKIEPNRSLYDKSDDNYLNTGIGNNIWTRIQSELKTDFTGIYIYFFIFIE